MKFEITAKSLDGTMREFWYDNERNALSDENGEISYEIKDDGSGIKATIFSKEEPLKKQRNVALLKIQLGLSCNYACDYCSQRFVERAKETSKKDIDAFIAKLDNLNFIEANGLKIEFWGGEPLVYWKTLKPLAEALQKKFPRWKKKPSFSIITNGSLLNKEICHWLYVNDFSVGLSHDGPGQHVRGPDPLQDEEKRQVILDFYKKMRPKNRISFNAMLHNGNPSRKAIYDYFVEFTGDQNVPLGEGSLVDAYDDGGMANVLRTKADHFNFRKMAFNDIFTSEGNIGFSSILGKVDDFTRSVLSQRPADTIGQKCGMDSPHVMAVDLRGNVLTCQNVSSVETSHNGESHLGGNLDDVKAVRIKTATHWRNRPHCASCPVVHLCRGACMFLEGDNWTATCANAYTDNIALFALAFHAITGFIPVKINGGDLPAERSDIWGDMMEHLEVAEKKVIQIKSVSAHKVELDGVEVFTKSEVKDVA